MSTSRPQTEALEAARALFEAHRAYLHGVAYRMLGTHSDADDTLQDAFVRLARVDIDAIEHPKAYLAQLVTRLCIDHLRSARIQRETYIGPWLAEPLVDEHVALTALPASGRDESPDTVSALRQDVSLALMLALERLSPLERAAFILHDVFDVDYAEVAAAIGREPAACRQLAARGRKHIREKRPRFASNPNEGHTLLRAFAQAAMSGELADLQRLLAEDVVFASDGGGKVSAATKIVEGPLRVAKLVRGIVTKHYLDSEAIPSAATVNGQPGCLVRRNGRVIVAMALDTHDGRIVGIYSVRNPDKLRHLNALQ